MNARRGLVLVMVALAAIFSWLLWSRPQANPAALTLRHPESAAAAQAAVAPALLEKLPPEPRSELADGLNLPAGTIQQDLRIVQGIVDTYRSNFHENPVGTNPEITSALMGRNHLLLVLIPNHHPAVNLKGELCDRWGRPFFFHQLSGVRMEIRSSGADRQMWTDDDVVLSPP